MFESAAFLYLYVETPLHAGVGFRASGPVDLPIQRDATTEHPLIRASSLKGAFRDLARGRMPAEEVTAVFGPEPVEEDGTPEGAEEDAFSAALILGDARLLLFPLRSLLGVFTWVTSADVLFQAQRNAATYRVPLPWPTVPPLPPGAAWVTPKSRAVNEQGQLVLEEYTFEAEPGQHMVELGQWFSSAVFPQDEAYRFWSRKVQADLALVQADAFRHFVTTRTEIVHRIRIDPETGTAAQGALWTEEFLPPDSILYCPVAAQAPYQPAGRLQTAADVLAWFKELAADRIQLGGGRTLGRGIVRLRWGEGGAAPA